MKVRFTRGGKVLAAAAATMAVNAVTSAEHAPVAIHASAELEERLVAFKSESENRADSVTLKTSDEIRWTPHAAARFEELSRAEAFGELSAEELRELELLTRLRRFEKYPRTADEILWTRRQRNLTRGLVHALEKYVEFHKAAHSPEKLSQKSNH